VLLGVVRVVFPERHSSKSADLPKNAKRIRMDVILVLVELVSAPNSWHRSRCQAQGHAAAKTGPFAFCISS
jgi:hypothetical protein